MRAGGPRWVEALVAFFALGCGSAIVTAPNGTSGADGGGPFDGDGAESSSGASGGSGSRAGTVACATVTCPTATQVCCAQPLGPGFLGDPECTPIGQCQDGANLSCSSAAECAPSQVCCFTPSTETADLLAGGTAACQSSCSAGQAQLCTTNAECTSGLTCQETSAGLPTTCRDAPEGDGSSASPAGGPASTPGECTSTLTSTAGGKSYQATCACPEGTCACFGPSSSTRIVSFTGCPFCPGEGSIGPTTSERVFALCGFPQ
jgi:hypothetical protein